MKQYVKIGYYDESLIGRYIDYDDLKRHIAAHAQMLEALKHVVDALYVHEMSGDETVDMSHFVPQIVRDAIAAAEGREP